MMKGMFKRALAGVAAAALAATGLALGAGAANAVNADKNGVVTADATFTFTGNTAGKSLTAYKIADYVQYGTGPDFVYGVQTNADNKQAVETALAAATTRPQYNAQTDGDAMAWAAQKGALDDDRSVSAPWSEGTTRKFAQALAADADDLKNGTKFDLNANTVNLDAGVYLFVDATNSDHTSDKTDPIAMIVYSGDVNGGKLTDPAKGRQIALKNYVTSVTMTVNGKETTTASAGQTLNYVITGKAPITTYNATTGDKSNYKFVDTPGEGQTIDFDSITVTVGTYTLKSGTDYVKPTKLDDNGSFTIDLTEYMKTLAPSAERVDVKVTYTATMTDAASVPNSVVVYDNEATAKDTTTVTSSSFSFTKTDAQDKHVGKSDATFKIYAAEDVEDNTAVDPTGNNASTDEDGTVSFSGLADGTYTVEETANSDEYIDNFAKFEVTIADGKVTGIKGTDIWGLAQDAESIEDYTVMNVKSVTQLPMTGAAGTALFTVLGLLIAGAGALVYMKSRNVKHALRG